MRQSALSEPSIQRTVILHVVAVAGLACGALTGVLLTREVAALQRPAPAASVSPASLDGDGEPGGGTCVLPGVRKADQRACDV